MTEIYLEPLSEGLGFCDKDTNTAQNSQDIKDNSLSSVLTVPHNRLSNTLDLDNHKDYDELLSLLEQPWLGENKEEIDLKNIVPLSIPNTITTGDSKFNYSLASLEKYIVSLEKKVLSLEKKSRWLERVIVSNDSTLLKTPTEKPVTEKPVTEKQKSEKLVTEKQKSEKLKTGGKLYFQNSPYFSLKSYLIDITIISLFFFSSLWVFAFLTTSQPILVLLSIWPIILCAFLLFSQVYCFLCRLFCLKTFGESSTNKQLYNFRFHKVIHPFMFFYRFLLSCITGVIVLPILSFIFKKDFMASLTGLSFQKV